ncbi:drug/metabolite transporter (DMT)-like permease [Paenibacillus endophyticus]|uniref:Drug/metabolite transporter (DMT)-like permease n=1 Tax=Paenibacillus endophyticus TaxID=1294268 RepID=A0A7W5CDV0_9BACL|nr:DMT family transporter [Paenibacillus endophyticus]MBB3155883.1 drug/metabolite transporter (DMT)-like permease [Paenibacillus endophyticus]
MHRSLFLVLLLLSLIWGGSYYFIKVLIQDFGPWTVVFLRSVLGLAVITLVMVVMRKPFQFKNTPWVSVCVMALVNTCIPWAIIGFSEMRLTSSMASILNATTPLWSLVVGVLFFGTVSFRMQWIGISAAIIGLIVLLGLNPASIISVDAHGFIAMIIASLFYGLGSHFSKRLLKVISTYQATFGTLLFSMLGSGGFALSFETISYSKIAVPQNMTVLIGLGIFGSGVAYILFYWIVQNGGPVFATMVTYLLPLFSLVWGALMLNEHIGWSMIAGLAFILVGVFLASGKGVKLSSKPKHRKNSTYDI